MARKLKHGYKTHWIMRRLATKHTLKWLIKDMERNGYELRDVILIGVRRGYRGQKIKFSNKPIEIKEHLWNLPK